MTTHSRSMIEWAGPVRLAHLFLRSRRVGWAALYLAGIAVLVAGLVFIMRENDAEGRDPFTNAFDGSPVPFVLFFVPLAMALVVGVAAHGPFGELERTVSQRLPPLRLGQVAGLLLCSAVALLLLAQAWEGGVEGSFLQRLADWEGAIEGVFLRNLAGFTGLALLTAPIVGARLSWFLPFGYGMVAFWIGNNGEPAWWLWPMQPMDNDLALGIALGLLAVGVAVASVIGSRESPGEAE